MPDPLQEALTALGTALRVMPGLTRWYDDPPESLNEFPCGLAWISQGEITVQGDWVKGLHSVNVDIYHSRQVLPDVIDATKVWPYRLSDALRADMLLGGKVTAIVWPFNYRCQPMPYGEAMHYGMRATVTLKITGG